MNMSLEGYYSIPSIAALIAAVAVVWFLFSKREIQSSPNEATATHDSNNNKTEASPSGSASSLPEGGVYQVFLSFSGVDTRKVFTDFLYTALVGAGIQTFRDDNELRVGKEISAELLKSIRESKISIPIFSQNYARSKWCLRELEQMVECHNNGSQMIYPLFYDVDPSDVRNQRGSYHKAFRQHKKEFSKDEVQRWRDALEMVGGLKGLELKKETNGHQGQFVKRVVENVLMELDKKYKHEPENLVGMDYHIKKLMELLEVESKDVRIIGIHGMGGLGKTTMSTVIYNNLREHFEGYCFLDNVREKSKNIVQLQKHLISEILNRNVDERFSDVDQGRNRIKNVVFRKKLLIVLDDVDNISQVRNLMGHQSWFCLQSRIIITTRYRNVLDLVEHNCQNEDPCVVYKGYHPEFMDDVDSLQLFSKHAFKKDSPEQGYYDHSMEVVAIAAGLPLALVVLGSTFYTITDKDLWEDTLAQVKGIPNKDVMHTLKFSFDTLEYNEKQIFLDIACFFIGFDKTRPCYLWESCGFYPRMVINVLVSRSLITIDDHDQLQMHDHLRDLGRQIVRDEGLRNNNPAEQSRLWSSDEALQILKTCQGTSSINALEVISAWGSSCTYFKVVATYFHNLPNLRYLSMRGVKSFDGDFKNLLPDLRWFRCQTYDLSKKNLNSKNLNVKNLVILQLKHVNFADDWDGWNELKKANNLKVLDLLWCYLQTLPNLSNFTKLVELRLVGCEKLTEIQGLDELKSLKILDAMYCWNLMKTVGLEGLICLEKLDFQYCMKLKGVGDLSKLNKLKILNVTGLDTMDFSHFKFLEEMVMVYNNIIEIPGTARLESLRVLKIDYCEKLLEVEGIGLLKSLESLQIIGCSKLKKLPDLQNLKSLKSMEINGCSKLKKLPDLQNLKSLKSLTLKDLEINEMHGLEQLISLECLGISQCFHLTEIPDFRRLKYLRRLTIGCQGKSTEIHGVEELKSLEYLSIRGCKSIEALPDLSGLDKLKYLDVSDCAKLSQISGIQKLKSLTVLDISDSQGLEYLRDLPNVEILS